MLLIGFLGIGFASYRKSRPGIIRQCLASSSAAVGQKSVVPRSMRDGSSLSRDCLRAVFIGRIAKPTRAAFARPLELSKLGHSHLRNRALHIRRVRIFLAAVATVLFSFISDAALTHCASMPILKVTGWCA
jgi:hypothetical protein